MICTWCDAPPGSPVHDAGCQADEARSAFLGYRQARAQAVRIGGDVSRIDRAYNDRIRELKAGRQVRVPTPRPRPRRAWLGPVVLAVGAFVSAVAIFALVDLFARFVGWLGGAL